MQNQSYTAYPFQIIVLSKRYPFWVLGIFFFIILLLLHKSKSKRLLPVQLLTVLIGGFIFSFLIIFLIAWAELLLLSGIFRINPALLGVSHRSDIALSLRDHNIPPIIVTEYKNPIVAIAAVSTGKDSFYAKRILPLIPDSAFFGTSSLSANVFLLDNIVIIIKENQFELQTISSPIAYLWIQKTFPQQTIKHNPKLTVLDTSSYQKYRTDESKKHLLLLDKKISDVEKAQASLSAKIRTDTELLTTNTELTKQIASFARNQYTECLAGRYVAQGKIINNPSKLHCDALKKRLDVESSQSAKVVTDWEKKLETDKKTFANYDLYQSLYTTKKAELTKRLTQLTHEQGVFFPKDRITLSYPAKNLSEYFETVVHEYLHFTSYVSDEKVLELPFFEEALTEYFTQKIMKQQFPNAEFHAYPVHVAVIKAMTKKIPEATLETIYFTKDQKKLVSLLNSIYGKDFYNQNLQTFTSLHYATDTKEMLKFGNPLLLKIGAKPLTPLDFLSL